MFTKGKKIIQHFSHTQAHIEHTHTHTHTHTLTAYIDTHSQAYRHKTEKKGGQERETLFKSA